ncbi:hypothetical protein [Actinoplanes solisilvae]|uniref:hypothetical protein n=1 Tax=Actinoplanes solisilvae TaxID=2486853 RepID=UPI000FD935D2|nr:hypothetical protein [Actinoplanes solisilvae]
MPMFAQLAALAAWFGVLGMFTASLNAVALRLVRTDEVPRYVRRRMRWWSTHNPFLMLLSTALTITALTCLATL